MAASALPEAPRRHGPVSVQDGLTGSAWGASRSALGWNTLTTEWTCNSRRQ